MDSNPYVVTRQRLVQAPPGAIFELLADPAKHRHIDGSDARHPIHADDPDRLGLGAEFGPDRLVGQGHRMRNIVEEFEEARSIAWRDPRGHRWRYELVPAARGTVVRETWDASRVKRHWTMKARGAARNTPVEIEHTLDRLADHFDPTTPRPATPEPPNKSKPVAPAATLTPAQAAKREADRRARAERAVQMDRAAAEARASKEQRAAHTAETRAARRSERSERAALARQAREARSVAKAEQSAQEDRAKAEKAAEAERMRAEKAERAAELERAKAQKTAEAQRVKAERAAVAGRATEEKAARSTAARQAKDRKLEKPAPVEPMPPIGGTAGPMASAPRKPSREAIAAAKAGRQAPPAPAPRPQPKAKPVASAPKRQLEPKPQPEPTAAASKPVQDPVRTGLPPAAARRLRRAS